MNETVGNTALFNIIIIFVIILIAFFIGSLAYSKAFKAKNKIIEEIERNENFDSTVETEVDSWLSKIGYRVNFKDYNNKEKCKTENTREKLVNKESNYQYCVYKVDTCAEQSNEENRHCGEYYKVTTYMYFDFPVIGQMIRIPIKGETMIFSDVTG